MITALVLLIAFTLAAGTIVLLVYYLVNEHRRTQQEQESQFRNALLRELQRKGWASFQFDSFVQQCGVPHSLANRVSARLYADLCNKALADGEISPAEHQKMKALSQALAIRPELAGAIEQECKEERYRIAVAGVLADGVVTESEARELELLRRRLGFNKARAAQVTEKPVKEGYLALFQRVVADGQVTEAELRELERYRTALGLSEFEAKELLRHEAPKLYRALFRNVVLDGQITKAELEDMRRFRQALMITEEEANALIRKDSLSFYREYFYGVIQGGEVTPEDEQRLAWIENQFGLEPSDIQPYRAQLQEVKRLSAYREGKLPSRRTSKLLEGGETCHWEGSCCFEWETPTKIKDSRGEMIVTSQRLIFTSPTKSFEFSPPKIIDIVSYADGLQIQTSGSRGAGSYLVDNPRELEAILVGLVRKHKFLQSENFTSSQSRHIPDTVKRAVWDRDGGCCVRCRAMEYLEFDHIIPHSRGGANTVNNVQILCRRCNLLKRDRI